MTSLISGCKLTNISVELRHKDKFFFLVIIFFIEDSDSCKTKVQKQLPLDKQILASLLILYV